MFVAVIFYNYLIVFVIIFINVSTYMYISHIQLDTLYVIMYAYKSCIEVAELTIDASGNQVMLAIGIILI